MNWQSPAATLAFAASSYALARLVSVSWEAVTAIASLLTGLVIAATVIVGIRQLRLTRDTLEHLRRATQLEGAMQIFADLNTAEFRESQFFIANQLADAFEDPAFRETVRLVGLADTHLHKELYLMRCFERIGAYVRNGLIDGTIVYDVILPMIVSSWEELSEVVEIHRQANGVGMWENFEYLYCEGKRWVNGRHGSDYLRPFKRRQASSALRARLMRE